MTEEQKVRKREWNRRYYQDNKEKKRQYVRQYYQDHREECIASARKWHDGKADYVVYLLELPDARMYIGSTKNLYNRITLHKIDSIRHPDRKLYTAIAESGGWDAVKVHVLMKDIPDKELRRKCEQHFLNMIPPELRLNAIDAHA